MGSKTPDGQRSVSPAAEGEDMIHSDRKPPSGSTDRELGPLNMLAGFAAYLTVLMALMGAVGFVADNIFYHIAA